MTKNTTQIRHQQTIDIQSDILPSLRSSFKQIATYSGNGCFIKAIDHNSLEISSYSNIAIQRAIAELRITEGHLLRQYLDTQHFRPNANVIIQNPDKINDELLTRIRTFVKDGCFLFHSHYCGIHSVYIKANTQTTVNMVTYIIQQTDLGHPIVINPPSNDMINDLFTNYTDTFDIIGKITKTSISYDTNNPVNYSIQSNHFHSIEYAYLLIHDFISAMEKMKQHDDESYITSFHVSMEELLLTS